MKKGKSFTGDLRTLPQTKPEKRERPEREDPEATPLLYPGTIPPSSPIETTATGVAPAINGPAPGTSSNFDGLDFATWGAGHPPDTNGDVGPDYYIQTVNTSIGIWRKSDGVRVAAFTFDTFMSQGQFGNQCDNHNFGDPVVLYDTFEDRWVLTDFAFQIDASGNVNPPHSFQCFAVSKTGDPVSGGWNFYSIETLGGLGDYPKFGIWPDGLYMSANMFDYAATGGFQGARVYALNKAQMYAGAPSVQVLTFNAPIADFALLPSNARLQAGTPPIGTPNYFISTWEYTNALTVYKFHVDWNNIGLSTFSGPDVPIAATNWPNASVANATSPGNVLDVLQIRAMMQNQYSNIGGSESLWTAHTVRRDTGGLAAPRWYQLSVTGGTVAPNIPQASTFDPDGANVINRFMPSVAVNRNGDMAIGYSTSNSTTNPAIKYAGRLAADAANTLTLGEQVLIQGTGTQSGNCGSSACVRWGDYSAMTLDPDGCTFWYTNEYYATTGLNDQTRIGSFAFPGCTAVGVGAISGTVTAAVGGTPLAGVTVALGSRTTTTDINGSYTFSGLPEGIYPSMSATLAGYSSGSASSVAVVNGGLTTQDFSLSQAPTNGCLTDTSKGDFLAGVGSGVDLNKSPGDIVLSSDPTVEQNATLSTSGVGINATTWGGQTFTAPVSGYLTKVDLNLFCSGCTGTAPNLALTIRAVAGGLPTGSDLAGGTIAGFNSGAGGYYTATLSNPLAVTSGTAYAIVVHPVTAPSAGTYALTRSASNVYANGARISSSTSGTTWTAQTTDAGFRAYIDSGYGTAGTFVSSVKDANPSSNSSAQWGTLSWNSVVPASSTLRFQVGGSDNAYGPFSYVGPDSTASSYFSNGDSLTQFNGQRYIHYKAYLGSSNSTVTPTVNDVSVCFNNSTVTSLQVAPASGTYGGTADLSATLVSGGSGVAGKSVDFNLNGNSVGSAVTDGSGVATVSAVSLAGIGAGSYPNAVQASFAGDSTTGASNGSGELTVSKSAQTIIFAALADKLATDADFTVSATASSGLDVAFGATGQCSVAGTTVHITGAGSCTITASQAGDANFEAASNVPQSFGIGKTSQTITFGALPDKSFGDADFSVSASASSGLSVSFGATGNCSVSGSTVHLTGAGSCTVTASQAGDANYSAAASVPQTFSIGKASQTIMFGALPDKSFGDADFSVSASASSGLSVSFGATGNCSVSGSTVHITGAGSCTITASQAGDSNYSAASSVPQTFSIGKASQTITFGALANKTFGDADFSVSASASSGLSVSFGATGNCSVSGSTVHLTGAGSCTITASQSGNANYSAASNVPQTFSIGKASQVITFGALGNKTFGDADFSVSASASSGLAVSFSATGNCTVSGNTIHLTSSGSCSITASQTGNADFNAAAPVTQSFSIAAKQNQTITFGILANKTYGNPDFTVSATASSGLAVSFSASGNCTVSGNVVHLTGAGSCSITASQAGNGIYNPAPSVTRSFSIAKGSQTITFPPIPKKQATDPDFPTNASASSGLPLSYSTSGSCTVVNGFVHITGTTNCTITASQAGNVNYNAAANVQQSFVITGQKK